MRQRNDLGGSCYVRLWQAKINLGSNLRRVSTMKFLVSVDRDEDGAWIIECPSIPGCVSQGSTKDEALNNIQDAIRACLDVRAEQGLPLTIETRQVEVQV
jgi:predicted RNase H-like HicB family nuclease